MCGIIAYVGQKKIATDVLLEGLRRLEYRGYDSAGIAVLGTDGLVRIRATGPVHHLEERLIHLTSSSLGIGHTRWATHGPPTETNAHPHLDCSGTIAVVHNGIIENYVFLKRDLETKGHRFFSETDTEVLAHLIEVELQKDSSSLTEAVRRALTYVEGTYGLAVLDAHRPEELVVARFGSPMIIGIGDHASIIASDPSAILSHTKKMIFLEDGEIANLSSMHVHISSQKTAQRIHKSPENISWSLEDVQKNGHPHFMLKEIFEEGDVLRHTLRGRLSSSQGTAVLPDLQDVMTPLNAVQNIVFVGCGTAYYAGCFGAYLFEAWTGIPTRAEIASEFRYRDPVISPNTAVIAISQSGETADTLAALRQGALKGALPLSIVNVVGSTLTRETLAGIFTHAGPEMGVASTKAFVSQCTTLALLALLLGRKRRLSFTQGVAIIEALERLPFLVEEVLKDHECVFSVAKKYIHDKSILFLGRTYHAPIAYEGALKLKEISYIHAEGFPGGEIKHGPLALIDQTVSTIVLCPKNDLFEKMLSNIQEIRARGGRVLAVTTPKAASLLQPFVNDLLIVPETIDALQPIVSVIPLQLFAYAISVARGHNPDRPRNLAKSVTVE